jgi:hypothetical protein
MCVVPSKVVAHRMGKGVNERCKPVEITGHQPWMLVE